MNSNLNTMETESQNNIPFRILNFGKSKRRLFLRVKRKPLTTKRAVELLLSGSLSDKVCRFCLNLTGSLTQLDQILQFYSNDVLYKTTIRSFLASFYPYQIADDPNLPNQICKKCLNRTLQSYFFTQQCEQATRAIHNWFEDINDKFEKLDPIEKTKKRGRQKLHPNYNVLHAEHRIVMDYAEPLINIINSNINEMENVSSQNSLECPKCWQVLPNVASLVNHEKSHPSTMWYSCKFCGKSFVKNNQLRKHLIKCAMTKEKATNLDHYIHFSCDECGDVFKDYSEYVQHKEKHKLKMVFEHLIHKNMDILCAICFDKSDKMHELTSTVNIYNGSPVLTGKKSLYDMMNSILLEIPLHDYMSSKICDKCFNNIISTYMFKNATNYTRNRLNSCIGLMLEKLKHLEVEGNVFIEISKETILPVLSNEFLNDLFTEKSELQTEVLEDEFRIDSGEETDSSIKNELDDTFAENEFIVNPAREAKKTYSGKRMLNGFRKNVEENGNYVYKEFLTFKSKKRINKKIYFTCYICCKKFITEYHLRHHMSKHVHKNFYCAKCNNNFESKFLLQEHNKFDHILKTYYTTCVDCKRRFKDDSKLKLHKKAHKCRRCSICDKIFSSQTLFTKHLERHIRKLKTCKALGIETCSFCEQRCSNKTQLAVHVNKVHLAIKPFKCDMCEKQFYAENNLNYHKKIHSLFRKEKCEFCEKTLMCRKSLVTHIRKHLGEKPFYCIVCHNSYVSKWQLYKHLELSHGGKYICKKCKLIFKCGSQLKQHSTVHKV